MRFKALLVSEIADKKFSLSLVHKSIDDLPPGEVLIRVQYSSLNYKDALSCTGHRGITKQYPHTPGIDAAGIVEKSADPHFKRGDKVLVTGYDLGMNTAGGFSEYIRVPASWPIHIPAGLSRRRSMMYGTAGLTAALSIYRLRQQGIKPPHGPILVSGASGGVGMMAVAILAHLGFEVVAVTRKTDNTNLLMDLGAKEVLPREYLDDSSDKVFLNSLYAGGIDTVGGNMLSTMLKYMKTRAVITCCGMVNSTELHTSIYPFILKGIHLIGIDSAYSDHSLKKEIWHFLASEWRPAKMDRIISTCTLDTLSLCIEDMLSGSISGRYLIKVGI